MLEYLLHRNIFSNRLPLYPVNAGHISPCHIFGTLSLQLETSLFPSFYGSISSPLAPIKHPPSRHFVHNEWPEVKADILGAYCYLPRLPFSHGWNLISYKASVTVCQTIRENIAIKLYKTRQNTFLCLFQIAFVW